MHLFEEFSSTTAQQWKEQIIKDLKGGNYSQLQWKTKNGFTLEPFYTSEDLKEPALPLFSEHDWDICEHIKVSDEKEANKRALAALEGGASGLAFYIHKKIDTKVLLKGISIEHIYTQFFISNDALHVLNDLKANYGKVNAFDGKIKCFVNIDPLCLLAYYGEWHENKEKDLEVLKQLVHIPLNMVLYQEAGSNTVNELAIGLAHLNEYFNYLNDNKILKEKTIHCTLSVNGDFYNEIAKLRALRKLIALLQEQYGTNFAIHFHAQTAQINKSSLDKHTNMIRTTTEAMSAIIGGCNSIGILPYNEGFEDVTEFSARIARNQQHVLKNESYLNKVADISAGSYYIETLSEKLAEHAWEQFKLIESKGGFIKCLENNFIQDLITADAQKLLNEVKEGKQILVGVNKYENKLEVRSQKSEVKSQKGVRKKTEIKPIKPIRLAEGFENKTETVK